MTKDRALTAWDLIGFANDDGHRVRIKGGRAVYDDVIFWDDTPGDNVILGRVNNDLSQTIRRVDPDTPLQVVDADGNVVRG